MKQRLILLIAAIGIGVPVVVSVAGPREAGGPRSHATATAPAQAAHLVKEADLATVTLSEDALHRLDIVAHLGAAQHRKLLRTRLFGGEVIPLPARSLTVAAPVAGTIRAAAPERPPAIGAAVRAREPLLLLVPLVSPAEVVRLAESQADAAGLVARAEVLHEAAIAAHRRVEALAKNQDAPARAVEEARAQLDAARADLDAAKSRRDVVAEVRRTLANPGGAGPDGGIAIPIEAGLDGALTDLLVAPGQMVAAGAPLFTVANLDRLWVRVAVPAVALDEVDPAGPAQVASLSAAPGAGTWTAVPAPGAPPTARAASSTVDLYYELEAAGLGLRPGRRVGVTVPLTGETEPLTIPWAAVLHDIHGGTWVYERVAPTAFARRRVIVERVQGPLAALAKGSALSPGAQVVTAGAAELFGVELGAGK